MTPIEQQGGYEPARSIRSLARLIFLALCLETLFAIFYRAVHLATHSAFKAWIAGLFGLLVCAFVFRFRHALGAVALRAGSKLPKLFSMPFFSLVAGLLVRIGWIARFHGPFTSDGDGYFHEAASLATSQSYGVPYWPPGFPLFLSTFFAVLGARQWVAWMCALLLFTATWMMVRQLAVRMTHAGSAGLFAGWILAVWPGYVTVVSINSKEMLLACIVAAGMLLTYSAEEQPDGKRWLTVLGIGVLTGCAALTQPGFTLSLPSFSCRSGSGGADSGRL